MGSRHRQNAPYQRFATRDGYVMVGAADQGIWERCARALGHPEWLEDERFATPTARRAHRGELEQVIQAVLSGHDTAHWIEVMEEAGVPCGPVYNYAQLFSDPQVVHRELIVYARDEELGDVPHIRTPIRLSGSDVAVRRVAPRLGEHTEQVLSAIGLNAEEIAGLRDKRII